MVAVSGESSTSSAESSFRQLDDVFLQTQTRIWLGEVLKMRLDEHLHISDLLADGDLLFEVSKVLWNMLLAKCGELRHLKYEPLGSRRCSGRYLPYSNVDSFLKICKILGLDGIDLFSPSDVVEKKNIRKVCICIRALSNKVCSKQLKVPDFDLVTYTVVMPKDMVGGIRRSLETSQCSLSSSSGYCSYKQARSRLMERNKTVESEENYDSLSEESDEAESKFMGEESCSSSMNQLEDDNAVDLDADNCFDEYSAVRKHSRSKFHHRTSRGNNGRKYSIANDRIHFDYSDLNVANDKSTVGDSINSNGVESSYISDYLAFSDSIIGGTDGSTPVLSKGEENIFNFFMASDSHGPNSNERLFQNKYSDSEDAEVSSTTSMSSVLCRVRALDFDDQFDADDCLITETPGTLLENEADRKYKDSSAGLDNSWNIATNELMFHDTKENFIVKAKIPVSSSELRYSCPDELQFAAREPLREKSFSLHGNNSNFFDSDEDMEAARTKDKVSLDNLKNVSLVDTIEGCTGGSQYLKFTCEEVNSSHESSVTLNGVNKDQSSVISANCCERVEKGQPCSCSSIYGSYAASEVFQPAPLGDDGDSQHKVSHVLGKNAKEGNQDTDAGQLEGKHQQRRLLKTVVRGTALVGVLYLLLHFSRRRNKQESSEGASRPSQSKKFRGRDFWYGDRQNGRRVDRVYPSEKLKLKN